MATNILDPNNVFSTQSEINLGLNVTPDYSDMFIFVELTAKRRTASVITTNGVGKKNTLEDTNDEVKINLMGFDNETGQYTTNWTNNIGEGRIPYEGFGMTTIKITTDSSYVPVVDIEFVDVRGLSLVSVGTRSKYSVLYSFPPPVFNLTIKGYYGKATTYSLHLVRQTTTFNASTGNYHINVNFVADRYSPLTDIPFKYIDIVPLMDEGVRPNGTSNSSVGLNPTLPPKNTRELIEKAKKLYDDLKNVDTNSVEAKELNEYRSKLGDIQLLIDYINNFKNNILLIDNNSTSNLKMIINTNIGKNSPSIIVSDINQVRIIKTTSEYNNIIKNNSPDVNNTNNLKERLCIVYEFDSEINNNPYVALTLDGGKYNKIIDTFETYKKNLLNEGKKIDSFLKDDSIKIIRNNDLTTLSKKYIGLDITEYYIQVFQKINQTKQKSDDISTRLKNKINSLTTKNLGLQPTIRNIFSILCNDIETLFREFREISSKSEQAHEETNNFKDIVQNNLTGQKFISAFPLITKLQGESNARVRAYPGDPTLNFTETEFPEITFVEDFMRAFLNVIKNEQINNLKESKDGDGNNKWIPANPFDSALTDSSTESPFKNIRTPNEILYQMINRYYIISQYTYSYLYYSVDAAFLEDFLKFVSFNNLDIDTKNDQLIDYLAKAEATNLINSIVDNSLLQSLELQFTNFKGNIDLFYEVLDNDDNKITIYKDITGDTVNYINIDGKKVTKYKNSEFFTGFTYVDSIEKRNINKSLSSDEVTSNLNFVDTFINNFTDRGFLSKLIFDENGFDQFTSTNIPYLSDKIYESDNKNFGSDFIENSVQKNTKIVTGQYGAVNNFTTVDNLVERLANVAYFNKTDYLKILNDSTIVSEVKAYFILNKIYGSLSFYDNRKSTSSNDINRKFIIPGVVEVPYYSLLYMGCLTNLFKYQNENSVDSNIDLTPLSDDKELFTEKYGINFDNIMGGYTEFLSSQDGNKLLSTFRDWLTDTSDNGFNYLTETLKNYLNESGDVDKREELLLDTTKNYGDYLLVKPSSRKYILNYNEFTFMPIDVDQSNDPVISSINFNNLKQINQNDRHKEINDKYFNKFFNEAITLIKKKKDSLSDLEKNFLKGIEDNDIKTQTYYSFKAIIDKWVVGLDKDSVFGCTPNNSLINEFKFVDKFFNDIGDKVVIDIRPIIELSQDYDVSVYSVLTKILSLNGFEFFPLQNFMSFQQNEWENTFKTFGSSRQLIMNRAPSFICMYIGGTSSQLDDPLSQYPDDGFKNEESLITAKNYNNDVRAFKVSFASQNQSMFTSISLSTNEHKETNESLAILSELAQDQSSATPVPKGQNLFSTYEQRSYTCNVESLGNAMIQPTQYFLLENVPMFNGAYIVLKVEHTIQGNSMKTGFQGVRVRAISNPLVTDFATSVGIKSGDASGEILNNTIFDGSTSNQVINPPLIEDMNIRLISPN